MNAVTAIIAQLDAALQARFCGSAGATFYGITEPIRNKDNQEGPAQVCQGRASIILPENGIHLFWMVAGQAEYAPDAARSYGKERRYQMRLPLTLYAVGTRKSIGDVCGGSSEALASDLVSSLPRERFDATTNLLAVQLGSIFTETITEKVLSGLYREYEFGPRLADIFAVEVRTDAVALLCGSPCGDIVPLCEPCADVTVTDTDGMVYEIPAGETFTCTACAPCPDFTYSLQFTFSADPVRYAAFWRSDLDGTVDFDAAVLSNVTTVIYYLNGIKVTGSWAIVQGDTLEADITFTNGANPASITLSLVINDGATLVKAAPDWRPCLWGFNPTNGIVDPNWRSDRNVFVPTGATTAWIHHDVDLYRITGDFEVRFRYEQSTMFGISFGSTAFPATAYNGFFYATQGVNSTFQLFKNGGIEATFPGINHEGKMMKYVHAEGVGISMWTSSNNGVSWTKWRDNASYSAGQTWFVCIAVLSPFAYNSGVEILASNITRL